MEFDLLVINPFGDHAKGDFITDPVTVAEILASEDSANVVKVAKAG